MARNRCIPHDGSPPLPPLDHSTQDWVGSVMRHGKASSCPHPRTPEKTSQVCCKDSITLKVMILHTIVKSLSNIPS